MLTLDDYSKQPRAPVQPEAKPLPDDHTLTLDDETKRAPAPVQGTRHFRNVSTPSRRRCAFSEKVKRHMSKGAPFQLKCLRFPMNKRMFSIKSHYVHFIPCDIA